LVKLLDVKIPHPKDVQNFSTILMVFEFVDWDLTKLIKSDTYLGERQVKAVLKRILYGLKYMHSAQLVHRDIKPANILLNSKVEVKVCDFGLARCLTENRAQPISKSQQFMKTTDSRQLRPLPFKKKVTTHVVTRYYRAPEICIEQQERKLLPAIDVWSVGCIFGELLQMLKQNVPNYRNRSILLPGKADMLLSPGNNIPHGYREREDQLAVIIDLLGTPPKEWIKKVKHQSTREWLMNQPTKKPRNLKEILPYGPP